MSQKLWTAHAEADTLPELVSMLESALSEAKSKAAGAAATPPTAKGPAAKPPAAKPPAPKPAAAPAAPAHSLTLEDVKNKLTELKTAVDAKDGPKTGIKAIMAVLKPFKVTNSTELKPEVYPAVIEAVEAALAPYTEGATEGEGGEDEIPY